MTGRRPIRWAIFASIVVAAAVAVHLADHSSSVVVQASLAPVRRLGFPVHRAPAGRAVRLSAQQALVESQIGHDGLLLQPKTAPTATLVRWGTHGAVFAWMITMGPVTVTRPDGRTSQLQGWLVFINAKTGQWIANGAAHP